MKPAARHQPQLSETWWPWFFDFRNDAVMYMPPGRKYAYNFNFCNFRLSNI